jgi:hypothetical protein
MAQRLRVVIMDFETAVMNMGSSLVRGKGCQEDGVVVDEGGPAVNVSKHSDRFALLGAGVGRDLENVAWYEVEVLCIKSLLLLEVCYY